MSGHSNDTTNTNDAIEVIAKVDKENHNNIGSKESPQMLKMKTKKRKLKKHR